MAHERLCFDGCCVWKVVAVAPLPLSRNLYLPTAQALASAATALSDVLLDGEDEEEDYIPKMRNYY